jgi:hypothetical protein
LIQTKGSYRLSSNLKNKIKTGRKTRKPRAKSAEGEKPKKKKAPAKAGAKKKTKKASTKTAKKAAPKKSKKAAGMLNLASVNLILPSHLLCSVLFRPFVFEMTSPIAICCPFSFFIVSSSQFSHNFVIFS